MEENLGEEASSLFKEHILGILKDEKLFSKQWKYLDREFPCISIDDSPPEQASASNEEMRMTKKNQPGIIILIRFFKTFSDQSAEAFEIFKNAYSKREISYSTKLIQYLSDQEDEFRKCSQVLDLLNARKACLKELTKLTPVFSWAMPNAYFPDYPAIEKFLKSKNEVTDIEVNSTITYNVIINSNEWISKQGFSADISTYNSRKKNVTIRKNVKLFEKTTNDFIKNLFEINAINEFFLVLLN